MFLRVSQHFKANSTFCWILNSLSKTARIRSRILLSKEGKVKLLHHHLCHKCLSKIQASTMLCIYLVAAEII